MMENLFVWLRIKMRGWKSEVGINLQLCPPLNKMKKKTFFSKNNYVCAKKINNTFFSKNNCGSASG